MYRSPTPDSSSGLAAGQAGVHKPVRFLAGMGRAMLSVLMPPLCLGCETVLGPDRPWLCARCRSCVDGSVRPRSRTIEVSEGVTLSIGYALDYGSIVSRLITELKYGDKPGVAGLLARLMVPALCAALAGDTLVVPVPVSAARKRERGYNQTELLARHIAGDRGLGMVGGALVKVRSTASQTGLEREERMHNVSGSFGVRDVGVLAGRRILLVDDVVTTGATLKDCARALLEAGAREVSACVAASAP